MLSSGNTYAPAKGRFNRHSVLRWIHGYVLFWLHNRYMRPNGILIDELVDFSTLFQLWYIDSRSEDVFPLPPVWYYKNMAKVTPRFVIWHLEHLYFLFILMKHVCANVFLLFLLLAALCDNCETLATWRQFMDVSSWCHTIIHMWIW